MFKEQKWNEDMQNVLKDKVEFLKREIVVKNSLIESLLVELYKKNSTNDYEQDELNTMKSLSSINNRNITSPRSEVISDFLSQSHSTHIRKDQIP